MTGISFYVASRLENIEAVRLLIRDLQRFGHRVTYDWTAHGPVFKPNATPEVNIEAMCSVADKELDGVRGADVVIVLLPGGRGTHIEFGAALAYRKPVLLVGEAEPLTGNGDRQFPWPCAFYHHPLVLRATDRSAVFPWIAAHGQGKHTRPRPLPTPMPPDGERRG